MDDKKNASKLDIADILSKFATCEEFYGPVYARGDEDVEFTLGANNCQWPQKIKKERIRDGRPCLQENRLLPFVNQVINQIRQARPSIIPKPVDDGADVETAEILRGVIRNIETTSDADSVYDTAARNSVMASVGWIRIVTDYAGVDTFDQEVRLQRIQNYKSVYLDPNHQRQDGSDAEYGFVFEDMDKSKFERLYPDAKADGFKEKGWSSKDTVRVAEYFYKDYETKKLVEYTILDSGPKLVAYEDKVPSGATVIRSRDTEVCTVKHATVTCADILTEGEFPGTYIPLVPVYGLEVFLEGRRDFFSLIHQGRDPQQMLNYWRSASAEVVALQPKAPFVGAVGQFDTYAKQWATANRANYATLEYDPVTVTGANGEEMMLPPPQRQAPPTSSGTMMQEALSAADAIKASLGMYDASMGAQTPDISGKAIISRQMQGDNATFHFVDNLSVGIRHVGRILVEIIPIVYSGKRIVRILGEDGTESMVPLNQPVVKIGSDYIAPSRIPDGVTPQTISFDAGKYDVVVEVGASYATKRQELANVLLELARVKPEIMDVAGDLLVKNLDVPGANEIAKRLRTLLPPELLGDDLEAQRLQNMSKQLQDLQGKLQLTEQALLAKQDNQDFQNQLDAKKVENDTAKLRIDAAKTLAEIQKMQAETHGTNADALAAVAGAIQELKDGYEDVSGALHVLLTAKEEEGTGAPTAPDNEGNSDVGTDIGSGAV